MRKEKNRVKNVPEPISVSDSSHIILSVKFSWYNLRGKYYSFFADDQTEDLRD